MILVNGSDNDHIELSDRGFQYGDGLFETIAVRNGKPVCFDRHLARLKDGCERLYIPFPSAELLTLESRQLVQQTTDSVLKIILTRGSGGRGYRQPDTVNTTRVLSLHPFPEYPSSYKETGIITRFCNTRLGTNPSLAGIKHLNRLEQVMARAEWSDPSIQEGIMLDINGYVIEGTMTNLFYVKNNRLYTSPIDQSGIAGIIRSIIMQVSSSYGYPVIVHNFTKEQLLSADELFLTNSIVGIWPVRQLEETFFDKGLITQRIQAMLTQFYNETIKDDF
ncbi:MAG: aminodeoxychorismate lyase [Methylococcales bacterium]